MSDMKLERVNFGCGCATIPDERLVTWGMEHCRVHGNAYKMLTVLRAIVRAEPGV